MPAFNFKAQFAAAVENGTKCQTIRAPRKDGRAHAKVGDTLYLYTGMRTKSCRLLRRAICARVATIKICDAYMMLNGQVIYSKRITESDDLRIIDNEFAQDDGFENFLDMADWFRETHGLPFEGTVIYWEPLPQSHPDLAKLRAERDALQSKIDAAPSWGAAVSAMQERVDGINRTLAGGA
jgi:hypothetical protein